MTGHTRQRPRIAAGSPSGGQWTEHTTSLPDLELTNRHLGYGDIEQISIDVARSGRRFLASELREQFFLSRLVDRVFTDPAVDDITWILKGGLRQLAASRFARHTRDGDLYADVPLDEAIASLQACVARQTDDGITYRLAGVERYDHHPHSAQVTFDALMDGRRVASVDIDVSTKIRMTAPPRAVKPADPLGIELERPNRYLAYHPADQVADKVAATFEMTPNGPSQRHRDLVDIELISMSDGMTAADLKAALTAEFDARNIPWPNEFDVPDRGAWSNGYAAVVGTVEAMSNRKFADGLARAKAFLDPVLSGSVGDARWDRHEGRWVPVDR